MTNSNNINDFSSAINKERSEQIDKILQSLFKAQEEFPDIPKNKTATVMTKKGKYTYKYADLPDILKAVEPVLNKNDLLLTQIVQRSILVTYLFQIKSGQYLRSEIDLDTDQQPQAVGSQLTYFRRYGICAILGIAADEDDDGSSAKQSFEGAGSNRPTRQAEKKPIQPANQARPGSFEIPAGKFKGSKLCMVPPSELDQYIEWVRGQGLDQKKPDYKQLCEMYDAFQAQNSDVPLDWDTPAYD